MMKKYATVQEGKVTGVFVCEDSSQIEMARGERLIEVDYKIRKGDPIHVEATAPVKHFNWRYLLYAAGATCVAGAALAIKFLER